MADNTPSGLIIWIEEFVRDLAAKASADVLEQHFNGLSPDDVQLRLLVLAQMVASNTDTTERKEWGVGMIKDMARQAGVDPDDLGH